MLRFPPRRILVPFDLSDTAFDAWRQAGLLAGRFGAALEAVYVEPPARAGETEYPRRRLDAETKAEITRMVRAKLGPRARIRVVEGDPVPVLLRAAKTLRADLIVMGTHGRTGLDRVWIGSTAEALSRLSPVPVLTARGAPRAFRSVLAPVNFTPYSDHGFFFAAQAAAALKARLTALHVTADPRLCANPKFRLLNLIDRLPPRTQRAVRAQARTAQGAPIPQILDAAKGHDLLVLVAHRKSLLENLVLGMTAERTIRHSPVPVLTVPAPKGA